MTAPSVGESSWNLRRRLDSLLQEQKAITNRVVAGLEPRESVFEIDERIRRIRAEIPLVEAEERERGRRDAALHAADCNRRGNELIDWFQATVTDDIAHVQRCFDEMVERIHKIRADVDAVQTDLVHVGVVFDYPLLSSIGRLANLKQPLEWQLAINGLSIRSHPISVPGSMRSQTFENYIDGILRQCVPRLRERLPAVSPETAP